MIFTSNPAFWNAFSAITSLLAFLAILLTIVEMRNQRVFTYRPKLIIDRIYISIKNDYHKRPIIWYNSEDDENKELFFVDIYVYNLGAGAAHDISVNWCNDKELIDKRMDEISKNANVERKVHNGYLHYNINDYGIIIENNESEHVPFIANNKPVKIQFSETMKGYLSFYPILKCKNEKFSRFILDETIPTTLVVKYKDIANKTHKIKIKFHVEIYIHVENIEMEDAKVVTGLIRPYT